MHHIQKFWNALDLIGQYFGFDIGIEIVQLLTQSARVFIVGNEVRG